MKFISLVSNFREALNCAEKAIGKSVNLPILSYFLIETDTNKIKISATNLDLAISTSFAAKTEVLGKATLPAKPLLAFLSQIGDDKIEVSSEEKTITFNSEHYHATFQGLEPDEFPIIPRLKQEESIKISGSLLKTSLEQVIPASASSEIRPELSSVFLNFEAGSNLKFVATDSFRLAEKTLKENQFATNLKEKIAVLIPLKTSQEALKISQEKNGDVEIFIDPNQIEFKWDDTRLISRLLEGDFPEYASVIPKEFVAEGIADKERILEALRVSGVFSSRLSDVKVIANPSQKRILFSARDASIGGNEAGVEASLKGKGVEVVFNYRYLLDGFDNVPEKKAYFGLGETTNPAMIKPEQDTSYFYIVMPIRL